MRSAPDTGKSRTAYPFAILRTGTGFAAAGLQFPALTTAPDRNTLAHRMSEQTALYLLDCDLDRRAAEAPLPLKDLDLSDYRKEGEEPDLEYVSPAPTSDVSTAIERALREDGVSYAELARMMEVPRSVVSRITNPFYFGHTTRTLRAVGNALDRDVVLLLPKRERLAGTAPRSA